MTTPNPPEKPMPSEVCTRPLKKLTLKHGNHPAASGEYCAVEAAVCRFTKGEKHSDSAKDCNGSPVIARMMIRLNDRWDDKRRQQLLPFVDRLPNTAGTVEQERKRAFMCADWACRELLPMLFAGPKLGEWGEKLRALPAVVNEKTAQAARDLARQARAPDAAAAYASYAAFDAAAAPDAAAAYASYAAFDAEIAVAKVDASVLALLDRLVKVKPGMKAGAQK